MGVRKIEMETIINYDQELSYATCYTWDKALMRRLDRLVQNHSEFTVLSKGDGWKEYSFPKKYVTVKIPRQLSEKNRQLAALRLAAVRAKRQQRKESENNA